MNRSDVWWKLVPVAAAPPRVLAARIVLRGLTNDQPRVPFGEVLEVRAS